jgi:heme/copper-type cytochrome/quinol oxidase subunit 3
VNSVFGTPFFVVTGIHGSHVLIGIAWASFILIQSLDGAFSERHYLGVEVFGLYWHFVDIVWIVLFSLIYLL